jgi:multidrug resistance protein
MREHRAKLGVLFLIVFVDLVGFGMVIPLLPLYAETFKPSPLALGFLMAAYSAMQFVFAPILGRLSDRFGRRPVLLLSLAGAVAGYTLLGVAASLPMLFVSRVVAGIAGANISTAQAVIADITGPEGRARGMGVIGAAFGLGFILGPAFGGLLFEHFGPGAPGLAAAATSALAFVLTWFLLPETLDPTQRDRAAHEPFTLARLSRALSHPCLGLVLAIYFVITAAFSGFEVTFAQYFSHRFALGPKEVSYLLVGVGLVGAIVQGGLIGRLVPRFGETRLVAFGLALAGLTFAFLPAAPSVALSAALLGVIALGLGLNNPSLSALASELADPDEVGGILGIYQGLSSLGRIVGPFAGELAYGSLGPSWPIGIASAAFLGSAAAALLLLARRRAGLCDPPKGASA